MHEQSSSGSNKSPTDSKTLRTSWWLVEKTLRLGRERRGGERHRVELASDQEYPSLPRLAPDTSASLHPRNEGPPKAGAPYGVGRLCSGGRDVARVTSDEVRSWFTQYQANAQSYAILPSLSSSRSSHGRASAFTCIDRRGRAGGTINNTWE